METEEWKRQGNGKKRTKNERRIRDTERPKRKRNYEVQINRQIIVNKLMEEDRNLK